MEDTIDKFAEVFQYKFDPIKDLHPVEQFGISLKESYVNGVVPSMIPDTDIEYNGIDDPQSILGKPSDIFDMYSTDVGDGYDKSDSSGSKDSD